MKILRSLLAAAALSAAFLPASAHADALPPDACLAGDVGKACSNAGRDNDQSGVCVAAKCTSPRPDGGSVESDCGTCVASDGGTTSSSGATSSSSGSTTDDADGGGCSTSQKRDGLTGGGMLALGLLAFAWSRRNRSAR